MVNKKSRIIVVLAMSLLVFTACGHRGPLNLPEGANPEAVSHNKEGIASWNKKDYKGALMHFSAASKIDGSSGEIHFNEAICYDKIGQHGVATKHFGVALKQAGGNTKLLNWCIFVSRGFQSCPNISKPCSIDQK
jgi:predicted small lipoprotein YifL